jgi:nucleotide-binding universal stress UspA family protein
MREIKKILVAIAFSKYSQGILDYAAKLAKDLDAQVVVGHVINVRDVQAVSQIEAMGYKVSTDDYVKGVQEERAASLEEMIRASSFPRDRVKAVLEVGHPAEKLMQIIEEEDVDLVVMGAKGLSDLPHVFAGSVAEKMFRHSPVPVLTYRG